MSDSNDKVLMKGRCELTREELETVRDKDAYIDHMRVSLVRDLGVRLLEDRPELWAREWDCQGGLAVTFAAAVLEPVRYHELIAKEADWTNARLREEARIDQVEELTEKLRVLQERSDNQCETIRALQKEHGRLHDCLESKDDAIAHFEAAAGSYAARLSPLQSSYRMLEEQRDLLVSRNGELRAQVKVLSERLKHIKEIADK